MYPEPYESMDAFNERISPYSGMNTAGLIEELTRLRAERKQLAEALVTGDGHEKAVELAARIMEEK